MLAARTSRLETHPLDDLVVLVERHALDLHLHTHGHPAASLELDAKQVLGIL